jgi:hypothetical protein
MDLPAAKETSVELSVPQTPSPFSVSNRKVLDICSDTKHRSKGLLTPCRRVGLSRKSPTNSVSPFSTDLNLSSTPRTSRFVPSVRNSKGLGKFNVNVFDKHTHEAETTKALGKRIYLENTNEKTKQCKYEVEKELVHDKRHEGTKEKKQTKNFTNNGQQSSIDALYCKVSNIQSSSNDKHDMMSPENVDGEMSTDKTSMGNLVNDRQCSVDSTFSKDLGLQNFNLNDTNSVIISEGTHGGRDIKANEVKHFDSTAQQYHVNSPFHKDSDFLSNSSNEDNMTNSENMIECTEQNFKILKQQIAVKEEEVERLKLILLYKKKVIHCFKGNFYCHCMFNA